MIRSCNYSGARNRIGIVICLFAIFCGGQSGFSPVHAQQTGYPSDSSLVLLPGFNFFDIRSNEYVLISRFDNAANANVAEFYAVGNTTPIRRWVFNEYEKFVFEPSAFSRPVEPGKPETFRPVHPWLASDGSLTFHQNTTPIYQVNTCNEIVWVNHDFGYHHSLEVDHEGNFWLAGIPHKQELDESYGEEFKDDHIVKISAAGETLYAKSAMRILEENELINRVYVYDNPVNDPIHLNDVQPVKEDGLYWRRGDVFISLGHLNMIMLFRPDEDKLVWWSQDHIMHQHDIDVLDDHRISVFDNRRTNRHSGPVIIGHNEIRVIDFETSSSDTPWSKSLESLRIKTVSQGLSDYDEAGGVMVEETNYGRLFKLAPDGNVQWLFLNEATPDGERFSLNWSRLISADMGDSISRALEGAQCGP